MDVMEAILKRRSIRAFTDEPVPDEAIERLTSEEAAAAEGDPAAEGEAAPGDAG